jgi:hypothetical protein
MWELDGRNIVPPQLCSRSLIAQAAQSKLDHDSNNRSLAEPVDGCFVF